MVNDDGSASADHDTGVWPLYVGLFLVLLTFFITIVAQSKPDTTSAVDESIAEEFRAEPGLAPRDDELVRSRAAAFAELRSELAGWVRFERVAVDSRSEELRMTLQTSELFAAGCAELRGTAAPLIDRAVAALSAPPPALRMDLQFVLGLPVEERGASVTIIKERALAIDRAASMARALLAHGAPPYAIAVGLQPGQTGQAQFAFRTSPVDAPRGRAGEQNW